VKSILGERSSVTVKPPIFHSIQLIDLLFNVDAVLSTIVRDH